MMGPPETLPALEEELWEAAYSSSVERYGLAGSEHRSAPPRVQVTEASGDTPDLVAEWLEEHWDTYGRRGNKLFVLCPWKSEHSSDSGESEAAWMIAGTGGYEPGTFRCFHASCAGRKRGQFLGAVGYREVSQEDFEDLTKADGPPVSERFRPLTIRELGEREPAAFLIKGFLPKADLGVIYGESTAGKSFFALDVAWHIATGTPWRGRRTTQARVAYVFAEGASGARSRTLALQHHHPVRRGNTDELRIIVDVPNLLDGDEEPMAAAILAAGGADLVIIDTLAQVTPGANENTSEDMGKALEACRRLRLTLGAMVVLVHHAGKDLSRGARGWSGLRAASDFEVEVARNGAISTARLTKLKEGEDGQTFPFTLRRVVLGEDTDGDEISSCVVEAAENAPSPPNSLGGKWPRLIGQCLEDEPDGLRREALIQRVLELAPRDPNDGPRDRRRDALKAALRRLVDDGVVAEDGDHLSLP